MQAGSVLFDLSGGRRAWPEEPAQSAQLLLDALT
jgi:hypothetical protein